MGALTTTQVWSDGDQVTSGKLNDILGNSTFTNDAVFNATLVNTGGKLQVGVIDAVNLGVNSVTSSAIAAGAVNTSEIAIGAVILSRLGTNSVDSSKIINGNVFTYHFNSSVYPTQAQTENETADLLLTPSNLKFAPMIPKVHGGFSIANTTRNIRGNSYNVQAITRIDSTHTEVTIARDMIGTAYTAIASFESSGTENLSATCYDRQAGSFKIMHPAEAAGRAVSFVLLGIYG